MHGSSGKLQAAQVEQAPYSRQPPVAEEAQQEQELVCEPPRFDEVQQSPFTGCRWASDPPSSRRFQVGGL